MQNLTNRLVIGSIRKMNAEDRLRAFNQDMNDYINVVKMAGLLLLIIIAYNYFFLTSLVLVGVGIPVYIHFDGNTRIQELYQRCIRTG